MNLFQWVQVTVQYVWRCSSLLQSSLSLYAFSLDFFKLPKTTVGQIGPRYDWMCVHGVLQWPGVFLSPAQNPLQIHQLLKINNWFFFPLWLISRGPIVHSINTNFALRRKKKSVSVYQNAKGLLMWGAKRRIMRFAALRDLRYCQRSYLKFKQQDQRRKKGKQSLSESIPTFIL